MRGGPGGARDVEEVRLRNLIYLCSDWLDPDVLRGAVLSISSTRPPLPNEA